MASHAAVPSVGTQEIPATLVARGPCPNLALRRLGGGYRALASMSDLPNSFTGLRMTQLLGEHLTLSAPDTGSTKFVLPLRPIIPIGQARLTRGVQIPCNSGYPLRFLNSMPLNPTVFAFCCDTTLLPLGEKDMSSGTTSGGLVLCEASGVVRSREASGVVRSREPTGTAAEHAPPDKRAAGHLNNVPLICGSSVDDEQEILTIPSCSGRAGPRSLFRLMGKVFFAIGAHAATK